ncbi:hypothetical protein QBC47DRAFT_360642 [Echria macrotheca]|uniref:Uncharacterized protein n=1 Tax=Echria macrotheca TaxID=438768 RepID=A0AAJ0FC21_9PEZI|nr:hypothetical protein QBC47DRAFT_360642 [Echria macrotheca]
MAKVSGPAAARPSAPLPKSIFGKTGLARLEDAETKVTVPGSEPLRLLPSGMVSWLELGTLEKAMLAFDLVFPPIGGRPSRFREHALTNSRYQHHGYLSVPRQAWNGKPHEKMRTRNWQDGLPSQEASTKPRKTGNHGFRLLSGPSNDTRLILREHLEEDMMMVELIDLSLGGAGAHPLSVGFDAGVEPRDIMSLQRDVSARELGSTWHTSQRITNNRNSGPLSVIGRSNFQGRPALAQHGAELFLVYLGELPRLS